MRWRPFLSHRHPVWRFAGAAVLALVLGFSGLYVARGPRPVKPQSGSGPFGGGTRGKYGTVTEQLGQGRFELSYETVLGGEEDGQLQGVKGRLEEPQREALRAVLKRGRTLAFRAMNQGSRDLDAL